MLKLKPIFIAVFFLYVSCSSDRHPTLECNTDIDCPAGTVCINGKCGSEGSCQNDLDCPTGKFCKDGTCKDWECSDDSMCGDDKICVDHVCITPSCTDDGDCDLGFICKDGDCVTYDGDYLNVSPSQIELGSVRLGTSVTETLTLSNVGPQPITVRSIEIESDPKGELSLQPYGPVDIEIIPGSSENVSITYTPSAPPEDLSTNILISSDDPKKPLLRVPVFSSLKGNVDILVYNQIPDLNQGIPDNISAINIPYTPAGESVTVNFYVFNLGSGERPLKLTYISGSGDVGQDITLNPEILSSDDPIFLNPYIPTDECSDSGSVINCLRVSVVFSPTESRDYSGQIFVESDDPDENKITIDVTASSLTTGELIADKDQIDFGMVHINDTKTLSVKLTNTGQRPVQLSNYGLFSSSSVFSIDPATLDSVAGESSVIVNVSFSPADPVTYENALIIETDESSSIEIPLTGNGIDPNIMVQPTTIDFGNVTLHEEHQIDVSVINTGIGTLVIDSISLASGSSSDFTLQNLPTQWPVQLENSDSIQFKILYTTNDFGQDNGTLIITSNDLDNQNLQIAITGYGENCPQGRIDTDKDPSNGCECELTNRGIEICDGVDNDCNGKVDDDPDDGTVYYRDSDADGYGDPMSFIKACSIPDGYVENSADCYDQNSDARPGQTQWFTQHRGDGSFDYNCDALEEMRYPDSFSCPLDCSSSVTPGWDGSVRGCGETGDWVISCSGNFLICTWSSGDMIQKTQECR